MQIRNFSPSFRLSHTQPILHFSLEHARLPAKMDSSSAEVLIDSSTTWGHEAARYETGQPSDMQDGIGPRDEALEHGLFSKDYRPDRGINFDSSLAINLEIVSTGDEPAPPSIEDFTQAKLHPAMLQNIVLMGYEVPTPIQRAAIPCILASRDLLAAAQTGSGKTGAFLIPIISKLMGKALKLRQPRDEASKYKTEPLVLILAPTRELAVQIFDECRRLCYRSLLRPCVIYGGVGGKLQKEQLQKGCDILVATPGRLEEFVLKTVVSFQRVRHLVLDEADKMLEWDDNFARKLLLHSDLPLGDSLQISMFSATVSPACQELATELLSDHYVELNIGNISTTTDITQQIRHVADEDKLAELLQTLEGLPRARTIIFVNHKKTCDTVDDFLFNNKLPVTSIHSDRTQREREDALIGFRTGAVPILVATDVASRGIDVRGVMYVINYDLPANIEDYIHRIGRSARLGNQGLAISFYNDRNSDLAPALTELLQRTEQEVPEFLAEYSEPL